MRLQLEPLALTLAAPHLKPAQFDRFDAFVLQHETARLESDPKGVRQADTGFLFELYRSCGSALLLSFIESLWLRRSPMFWEARWALLGSSLGRAPHRHKEITDALRQGETAMARDFLIDEISQRRRVPARGDEVPRGYGLSLLSYRCAPPVTFGRSSHGSSARRRSRPGSCCGAG
ncbi:FCD domain-containing protein [Sinorhizobium meliloti]|nr:FCD domain-containing protein [Sinorhizobium meliloti]